MTEKKTAAVYIIMGSDSDLPIMTEAKKVLDELDIKARVHIASAHRSPDKVLSLVKEAEAGGAKAFIAGAGFAAHLAGVIAGHTVLPVIGVPLPSSDLNGMDSLLATVQMPAGIPVATVTIGKTGAKNAAFFAAEIIATSDQALRERLQACRQSMAAKVQAKDEELQQG